MSDTSSITIRTEWKILGRMVGTGTGWDEGDAMSFVVYEFEPAEGVAIPKGDVWFSFEDGIACIYSGEGHEVSWQADLVTLLQHIPKT